MAITSIGYDGPLNEAQWADLVPSVGSADYGVQGITDWKVTAHPSTAQAVNVALGTGWGHGVMDVITDSAVTVQAAAIASGTRWDLIVARRDWQPPAGSTTFVAITGGAAKALPPRNTNPGVIDDQPLALVQWQAGQTQPVAIVDLRTWAGNGGMAAADDLALTYLSRMGARVTINGTEWAATAGLNNTVAWTTLGRTGRVPLFGIGYAIVGPNAPHSDFLLQAGTAVLMSDQNGFFRLYWPRAFPSGLLTVQFTNGDNHAAPNAVIAVSGHTGAFGQHAMGSLTEVVGTIFRAQDGVRYTNTWFRLNWTAWGY